MSLSTKERRFFELPCFFKGNEKERLMFLGRRLTLKNSTFTPTPAIFYILQVTFNNLLCNREVHVQLEQDVIAFAFGGVKVLVEFCRPRGTDYFIDILAASTKASLDDTIEWLQDNVISEVEKVCAQPRAFQCVDPVHAIIQQASIENMLEASKRPAVLIKELQDELKKHLEKKGADDRFKTPLYTWQIEGYPSNGIEDLLGEKETSKIYKIHLDTLRAANREISSLFVEEAESRQQQKPQFGRSQSSQRREIIYDKFCHIEQDVRGNLKDLKHEIQDLRKEVLPKLCNLLNFVQEGEAGKLPRMFWLTEDAGFVQRTLSITVPSLRKMRLRLYCECQNEPCHFVDGKQGLSLGMLDEGLLKRGLPYIKAFLKVAFVAVKVGAHVAVGCGNIIPDFSRLLATVADTSTWNQAPALENFTANDRNSQSRMDPKEGQQWLFDILSSQNCTEANQIYAKFGLRHIRRDDSTGAWVCDTHYGGAPWPA